MFFTCSECFEQISPANKTVLKVVLKGLFHGQFSQFVFIIKANLGGRFVLQTNCILSLYYFPYLFNRSIFNCLFAVQHAHGWLSRRNGPDAKVCLQDRNCIVHIAIGMTAMVFTGVFYHDDKYEGVSNGWGWGFGSLLFIASGSVAIAGGCKKTKSLIRVETSYILYI